jgi:hypothetical protein
LASPNGEDATIAVDKSRNKLLESIRDAGGLKKLRPTATNDATIKAESASAMSRAPAGDMASLLAAALAQRKRQQQPTSNENADAQLS